MNLVFRTDPITDSVYSLRMANHCLLRTWKEELGWKWVIIALHNSLQGFMACAIAGSHATAAVKDRTKDQRHVKSYRNRTLGKSPQLIDFMDLYQRIKDPKYMCRLAGSKEFQASDRHDEQVALLNADRNEFMHYFPNVHMSAFVDVWLPMIRVCAEIVEFLCFESENIFLHGDEQQKRTVRETLAQIREQVERIQKEIDKA